MGQREGKADVQMNQYQLIQAVAEVRAAAPTSPTPTAGQFWFNNAIANGTGNGVFQYRDNSGNNITIATGGSALSNAFVTITDGTTPAVATAGAGTFKLRVAGSGLAVATQNDDGTHGDNALFTLDSATSGNSKVLLTDSTGGLASMTHVNMSAGGGGTAAGSIGYSSGANGLTLGDGSSTRTIPTLQTNNTVSGTWTFQNLVASGSSLTAAGAIGYSSGFLQVGDGSTTQNVTTAVNSQTLTNKTLTVPILSGTAPTNTNGGQLGFASTDLQFADGTNVQTVVTTTKSQTLTNKTLTTPTIASHLNAGHNHQDAAGGSTLLKAAMPNFDTDVRLNRLDQMAAPTASVSMNSQKIINLLDGTGNQDAATYGQLLNAQLGTPWKANVRGNSTTNITIASPGTTIDGLTAATNERYLLSGQSTGSQNGIYLWNGSAVPMTRTTDADTAPEIRGAIVAVEEGTSAGQIWNLVTDNITLGTTALVFQQIPGPQDIVAGAGMTKTSNTLNVIANGNGTIVVAADDVSVSTGLASAHTMISGGTAGVLARTAANTITARSLAAGNGISVTNTDFSGGNPSISITNAISAGTGIITTYNAQGLITSTTDLIGTAGIPARTGANTYAARSIAVASTSRLTITDPAGTAGNPTLDLATVVSGGTFGGITYNNYGQITAVASQTFTATMTGAASTFTHTHNFGTRDVIVQVYDNANLFTEIYPEIRRTTTNAVDIVFGANLGAASYRAVIRVA